MVQSNKIINKFSRVQRQKYVKFQQCHLPSSQTFGFLSVKGSFALRVANFPNNTLLWEKCFASSSRQFVKESMKNFRWIKIFGWFWWFFNVIRKIERACGLDLSKSLDLASNTMKLFTVLHILFTACDEIIMIDASFFKIQKIYQPFLIFVSNLPWIFLNWVPGGHGR